MLKTHIDLDSKEVGSATEPFQEETAPTTDEITLAEDGYTVTQHVSFLHVMCTQG